jgi:hypothetical protein
MEGIPAILGIKGRAAEQFQSRYGSRDELASDGFRGVWHGRGAQQLFPDGSIEPGHGAKVPRSAGYRQLREVMEIIDGIEDFQEPGRVLLTGAQGFVEGMLGVQHRFTPQQCDPFPLAIEVLDNVDNLGPKIDEPGLEVILALRER